MQLENYIKQPKYFECGKVVICKCCEYNLEHSSIKEVLGAQEK